MDTKPDQAGKTKPRKRPMLRVLTVFLAVVITLVLVEVGLRLFWKEEVGVVARMSIVADENVGFRLRPDHESEYGAAELKVPVVTNALGYRDRPVAKKAEGVRRIMVLGDSFAFGHGVMPEQGFADLIESKLGASGIEADVVNTGVPGYATWHQFRLLEQDIDKVQPDDVILTFYIGNDFRGNHTEKFGRLVASGGYLAHVKDDESLWDGAGRWLVTNSRLALFTALAFRDRGQEVSEPKGLDAKKAKEELVRLKCEGADWDESFGMAMIRKEWDTDAEAAWRSSILWLTATRDLCKEKGVRFHLAVLPGPQQYSKFIWRMTLKLCGLNRDDFARNKPNRKLVEWAQANGVPVVDLLPAFWKANHDESNRLYLDCHFSALGHELAADTIIERLKLAR